MVARITDRVLPGPPSGSRPTVPVTDPADGHGDSHAGPHQLPVLVVQERPVTVDDPAFETRLRSWLASAPRTRLIVLPELHLCPLTTKTSISDLAEPIPGPRVQRLGDLARALGVWLLPGSVYERAPGGAIYNTAVALAPDGRLVATYRKCFPWRPYERTTPGTSFVVFDVPGAGRLGMSICYDLWFPEVARHLAWMGADIILQPSLTATPDREQELVLARATAIVNQVFVVNVNAAAPYAMGRSLIVDPQGRVRAQAGEAATALADVLDLGEVERTRAAGTAGVNRPWDQFGPGDLPLPLPLYEGRIEPGRWRISPDEGSGTLSHDGRASVSPSGATPIFAPGRQEP